MKQSFVFLLLFIIAFLSSCAIIEEEKHLPRDTKTITTTKNSDGSCTVVSTKDDIWKTTRYDKCN